MTSYVRLSNQDVKIWWKDPVSINSVCPNFPQQPGTCLVLMYINTYSSCRWSITFPVDGVGVESKHYRIFSRHIDSNRGCYVLPQFGGEEAMGCAPSITVSQSGVVYCRDSDESNSPKPSSFSQQQHVHITTTTGADIDGALPVGSLGTAGTSTTTVTVYHGGSDRRGTISIEAETQTSRSSVTMKVSRDRTILG